MGRSMLLERLAAITRRRGVVPAGHGAAAVRLVHFAEAGLINESGKGALRCFRARLSIRTERQIGS